MRRVYIWTDMKIRLGLVVIDFFQGLIMMVSLLVLLVMFLSAYVMIFIFFISIIFLYFFLGGSYYKIDWI